MKTIFLIITFSIIFFIVVSFAHALPTFQEVENSYKKSDAVLLDRHGKVIHELRVDSKGRRLDWISIKDISPALIKTVIHSEDRRFYEHHGVDWKAVGSTVIKNVFAEAPRGASTITMQLVSILDKKLKPKSSKRTLSQKWNQINAAKEIEKTWTKDEIFEAYLNMITFRGELRGVSAASRGLFDKEPSGLSEGEALILASLIRAPNAMVEDVIKRACILGSSIKSSVRCDDIKVSVQKTLTGAYSIRQRSSLAPHAAHQLLIKNGASKNRAEVFSTLDGELQLSATEILRYQLSALKDKNVNDGAVLIVENKTGDVLAYVANGGLFSSAKYIDGVKAKRQAGSTLKPFLYEMAIEENLLTASSIVEDSPINVSTPAGLYVPQDYDNEFKGSVSVRTALSASLNIPAVRTLMLVGPDSFTSRLKQLGIKGLNDGDYYGLSLALGTADVSLYELVNAYRVLANNGRWGELRLSFDKKNVQKQILKKEAVFIISDILSDRTARSITFGFENPLATRFWTAVKTGTSKDMRDNWCIGYSQKYTVGVWVGNFNGEPMWNVSGITGAAPIWLEVMNYLHRSTPSKSPQPSEGVISKKIAFQNRIEPERDEWFILGTEPIGLIAGETLFSLHSFHKKPRITYPIDGTIIALDPDVPETHQMLFFEAEGVSNNFEWLLNKEKICDSIMAISWRPQKGKYILSLVDKQKGIIDSVTFEVKGTLH